jgi:hypothetical protein
VFVTGNETIIIAEMDNNGYTSSVGIATGYGLDGWSSISSWGKRFFCSPQCPYWLWGLPSLLSYGYWGTFPKGVKRPRRELDHSPPFSAEIKNCGAIPPLPHVFMTWDNFTFLFALETKYHTTDLKTRILKFIHRKQLQVSVNFMSAHRSYELIHIFSFNGSFSPFRAQASYSVP